MALKANQQLIFRLGAAYDDTNHDDAEVSAIGDITLNTQNNDGTAQSVYLSYAQASQVAGYTAIGGSDSGGLFRSNYNLERETTSNLELGLLLEEQSWQLNFPDHRLTLGAVYNPTDILEFRIDNEWRTQHKNALRNGNDNALFTQLTLKITPPQLSNLFITLAADNLWDESFEEIPGTPGRGEQYTLSATYSW